MPYLTKERILYQAASMSKQCSVSKLRSCVDVLVTVIVTVTGLRDIQKASLIKGVFPFKCCTITCSEPSGHIMVGDD